MSGYFEALLSFIATVRRPAAAASAVAAADRLSIAAPTDKCASYQRISAADAPEASPTAAPALSIPTHSKALQISRQPWRLNLRDWLRPRPPSQAPPSPLH